MPIIYIHGVANDADSPWRPIEAFLRRYVAPVISPHAESVSILRTEWWPFGAEMAWGGRSRPRTPLTGMGAMENDPTEPVFAANPTGPAFAAMSFPELAGMLEPLAPNQPEPASGLAPMGPRTVPQAFTAAPGAGLQREELLDLLALHAQEHLNNEALSIETVNQLERLLAEPQFEEAYDRDPAKALEELSEELVAAMTEQDNLVIMGPDSTVREWFDSFSEQLGRTLRLPGHVLSRVAGEFRGPINTQVTHFLGDVFAYLNERKQADGAPGPIAQVFLDSLQHATSIQQAREGEPLVVLSHSMGGQIVYDALTWFLPQIPEEDRPRIDFWAATASQVGLFEEMKLFLASDKAIGTGQTLLKPPGLGYWWNVWDYNDFISYTVKDIFRDVDDEAYNSRMSLISAHSGYLKLPSFYKKMASKLKHHLEAP